MNFENRTVTLKDGRTCTLRAIPVVGAAIGGLFDTAQMNTILEYADIFYNKRFILEKDVRVSILIDDDLGEIIDV